MASRTGYRIVKRKWASSAFDGEGARRFGGRWNSKGVPCVYLSSSISLAALEMLVHLQSADLLQTYALFTLDIPHKHLRELDESELPANWRDDPAPGETAAIGDEWLRSGEGMALLVPSTVVPLEYNLILNPRHPAFADCIDAAREIAFNFDQRLK